MSDFCSGCGVEHHWRNCPEVSESVFEGEDPEWVEAELAELEADLAVVTDPWLLREMVARRAELMASWDPTGTPDPSNRTEPVLKADNSCPSGAGSS